MKLSTALTLAAATALFTAAAFIQRRQNVDLQATNPVDHVAISQPEASPAGLTTPAGQARASAPSPFRVTGILVQRELSMDAQFGSRMPFPGSQSHVRLALEYTSPMGDMIDWDRDACTITAFTDDRGQDLVNPDDVFGQFEMMPTFSDDQTQLAFVLQSSTSLSADATRIMAEGTVAIQRASKRVVHRSQLVHLELDSRIVCGPFDMEVSATGASPWSNGWEVTLDTNTDLGPIISWSFLDDQGNRVELEPSSSMSGMGSWSQSLTTPIEPTGKGTLEMECWEDIRTEHVPFRAEAGIGL